MPGRLFGVATGSGLKDWRNSGLLEWWLKEASSVLLFVWVDDESGGLFLIRQQNFSP